MRFNRILQMALMYTPFNNPSLGPREFTSHTDSRSVQPCFAGLCTVTDRQTTLLRIVTTAMRPSDINKAAIVKRFSHFRPLPCNAACFFANAQRMIPEQTDETRTPSLKISLTTDVTVLM